MNIDKNVQKVLMLLLKRWKLLVIFGFIGIMLAYVYTANFTTLTYVSTVQFLSYAVDTQQEFSDSSMQSQASSNTSKMNYAMKMMDTYIALFETNEFNQKVADDLNESLNTNYSAATVKGATTIESISNTAFFKFTVTTNDADLSYQIAHQLESTVVDVMKSTNNGLVEASVEDKALRPSSSESPGYVKKCAVGFIIGAVLAAAYLILRDLLDVRIKSSDELSERYEIPVLGTIPEFEFKSKQQIKKETAEARREAKSNG